MTYITFVSFGTVSHLQVIKSELPVRISDDDYRKKILT